MERWSQLARSKYSTAPRQKMDYVIQYLGDGDSSSFKSVNVSKPYPGVDVKKIECIGHLHKRTGISTKNTVPWQKMSDNEPIFGIERLTFQCLDKPFAKTVILWWKCKEMSWLDR